MKNRVLLVLLLSFAVSLAASAQKITMNLQQVKLEKVFSLITKQTGLTVAYSRTIVNPERIVSVQAKDKDLSKVLDDLFAGTNVAYEIGEKKIYLKAKEAPAASQGSQKTKKITGTIIRKSKFPQNPKRSVRFSGKRTKRSVQKRKARNTQKAETKVL